MDLMFIWLFYDFCTHWLYLCWLLCCVSLQVRLAVSKNITFRMPPPYSTLIQVLVVFLLFISDFTCFVPIPCSLVSHNDQRFPLNCRNRKSAVGTYPLLLMRSPKHQGHGSAQIGVAYQFDLGHLSLEENNAGFWRIVHCSSFNLQIARFCNKLFNL